MHENSAFQPPWLCSRSSHSAAPHSNTAAQARRLTHHPADAVSSPEFGGGCVNSELCGAALGCGEAFDDDKLPALEPLPD